MSRCSKALQAKNFSHNAECDAAARVFHRRLAIPGCRAILIVNRGQVKSLHDNSARNERGSSSGVEHHVANVGVEGSNPFSRS